MEKRDTQAARRIGRGASRFSKAQNKGTKSCPFRRPALRTGLRVSEWWNSHIVFLEKLAKGSLSLSYDIQLEMQSETTNGKDLLVLVGVGSNSSTETMQNRVTHAQRAQQRMSTVDASLCAPRASDAVLSFVI